MSARESEIVRLKRERPRSRFVRVGIASFLLLTAYAWLSGEIAFLDVFSERRQQNALRFLGELTPYPLRDAPLQAADVWSWAAELWSSRAGVATRATLAISVAAIVLAGAIGILASLPAARNVAHPEPFLPSPRKRSASLYRLSGAIVAASRLALIFARAIPEYIWAFLLVKTMGFGPAAAVYALAIHNAGILGKLGAETIEDVDPSRAAALRGLGAGRTEVLLAGVAPEVFPRFLLYFFYRWETCVREATVLGMLGVASLGSLVRDARAAAFYDEMFFFVLMGALLVIAGDILSAVARGVIRRSG